MANYTTIQRGSQGEDTKKWQKFLRAQGYNLAIDGIFGDETDKYTREYQSKNNLTVDGIVGEKTWAGYADYERRLFSTPTTPTATNTATNTAGTVGTGFEYKDFEYDDFNYDKTYTPPKDFEYDDFEYGDYQESDTVKAANQALQAHTAKKPGEYQSKWQSQLDDAINRILNREKFSYDFNGDALYQQYKDKYIQQGKMAMADTMGQAAAMTGGYGNSYAASAGNQAYQQSLQQLNDIVPELYKMAYDRYNQEGQDLYNQYGMLTDRENTDYGRYRDSVSDWQNERDYLTGRYDSERNFDYSKYTNDRNFEYGKWADDRNFEYGKWADDRNFNYNQFINDRNFEYDKYVNDRDFEYGKYSDDRGYAYNNYRDGIEDRQWEATFNEGVRQYNEQFEYQKGRDAIADSQWQKEFDEAMRQYNESMAFSKTQYNDSKKVSSGGGSYTGSSGSHSSNNGGSGGTGNTGNTGNTNNKNTGGVSGTIQSKASSFSNNDDLANYLDGLAASGVITESQADALYAENKTPEKVSLNKRSWTLVDDGGVNWLWGVDNNAVVKDQYGNTYKLGKLVDALVADGMSKSDAKAYVKKLQKQLGA